MKKLQFAAFLVFQFFSLTASAMTYWRDLTLLITDGTSSDRYVFILVVDVQYNDLAQIFTFSLLSQNGHSLSAIEDYILHQNGFPTFPISQTVYLTSNNGLLITIQHPGPGPGPIQLSSTAFQLLLSGMAGIENFPQTTFVLSDIPLALFGYMQLQHTPAQGLPHWLDDYRYETTFSVINGPTFSALMQTNNSQIQTNKISGPYNSNITFELGFYYLPAEQDNDDSESESVNLVDTSDDEAEPEKCVPSPPSQGFDNVIAAVATHSGSPPPCLSIAQNLPDNRDAIIPMSLYIPVPTAPPPTQPASPPLSLYIPVRTAPPPTQPASPPLERHTINPAYIPSDSEEDEAIAIDTSHPENLVPPQPTHNSASAGSQATFTGKVINTLDKLMDKFISKFHTPDPDDWDRNFP